MRRLLATLLVLTPALSFDFSVHQAAGMIAVQGSMGLGDALIALRAHAFGSDLSISELAQKVIRRETAFDPVTQHWRDRKMKTS